MAPYVFTKKKFSSLLQNLRSKEYLSTFYLDDLFLIGQSHNECLQNMSDTKCLLESLGFIINTEKSILVLGNTCKFLGNIIDLKKSEVRLPEDKKERIKKDFLVCSHLPVRQ